MAYERIAMHIFLFALAIYLRIKTIQRAADALFVER